MGSKTVKFEEEKEDRISDLPDPIIQHIISFLPTTKQSIQTEILSKRWKNQWNQVPVLIINNSTTTGMSDENFFKSIHNTLIRHDCFKINKFHLYLKLNQSKYPAEITSIISFATSKDVEDLNLSFSKSGFFLLPEFIFNNASLVKLRTQCSSFMLPNGKVNWGSLTTLSILHSKLTDQVIEQIVCGSPVLESLELASCSGFDKIVIVSKYLKRLVLLHYHSYVSVLEISCPNLVEFSLDGMCTNDPNLFARAIESVLSRSLVLESLSIQSIYCTRVLDELVIASQSLKTLVIRSISSVFDIEISCPKLEILNLFENLNLNAAKLLNFSSSLSATIDFHCDVYLPTHKSLVKDILQKLQRVKELKLGTWFISILSTITVGCRFSPRLSVKCLTLDTPYLIKHHTGIARLLRISPVLEKLVIHDVVPYRKLNQKMPVKNYWISNVIKFECLVSHLKTIKIIGFRYVEGDVKHQHMINFVQFLLNNAKVLERMVIIFQDDGTGRFPSKVSQELLRLPICSQNFVIEFQCFKGTRNLL